MGRYRLVVAAGPKAGTRANSFLYDLLKQISDGRGGRSEMISGSLREEHAARWKVTYVHDPAAMAQPPWYGSGW